jgi:hypothetical protein
LGITKNWCKFPSTKLIKHEKTTTSRNGYDVI